LSIDRHQKRKSFLELRKRTNRNWKFLLEIQEKKEANRLTLAIQHPFGTSYQQETFATRDFIKGEKVLHWNRENTITKSVFQKISDAEKKYITLLNGRYTIMQSPEKYVNHSCEPNTTAKDFCDIAIRDIKKVKK